jgi:hypothetical protein
MKFGKTSMVEYQEKALEETCHPEQRQESCNTEGKRVNEWA